MTAITAFNPSVNNQEQIFLSAERARADMYNANVDLKGIRCIVLKIKPGVSRRDAYGDIIAPKNTDYVESFEYLVVKLDDIRKVIDTPQETVTTDSKMLSTDLRVEAMCRLDLVINRGDRVRLPYNGTTAAEDQIEYEFQVAEVTESGHNAPMSKKISMFHAK